MAYAARSVDPAQWLKAELATHIRAAFQVALGEVELDCVEEPAAGCAFFWRQPFVGIPGALWIAAADGSNLQTIATACDGIAGAISGLLERHVGRAHGEEKAPPAPLKWLRFDLMFAQGSITIFAAADAELLSALVKEEAPTKTFDLLFDVELPVSVSFGRAQVPLKDVLKLTTGSIIELNRAIGDPVEVIVNNCVIARGEVVTLDGNFGVRIHQVISRHERLRTLK
jgi:flagellar motor switch protein FliN/FliY